MGSVVKYERTLFEPEHDLFRESYRAFLDRHVAPYPRAVGEGQDRRPRGLAGGRQAGLSGHGGARGVRRRRQSRLPLQRDRHRGDHRGPLQRHRLRPAQRRRRALPAAAGQRGAEAALAAEVLHRRDHHRDRDDRARHRQRPAGHQDPRGQRGRPLRPQRRQDVHHQRHQRRPGDRGRLHRPRQGRAGLLAAGRRARHGGLRARPQPRQDRSGRAGHRRAVVHRRARCPPRTCSARRAWASST